MEHSYNGVDVRKMAANKMKMFDTWNTHFNSQMAITIPSILTKQHIGVGWRDIEYGAVNMILIFVSKMELRRQTLMHMTFFAISFLKNWYNYV